MTSHYVSDLEDIPCVKTPPPPPPLQCTEQMHCFVLDSFIVTFSLAACKVIKTVYKCCFSVHLVLKVLFQHLVNDVIESADPSFPLVDNVKAGYSKVPLYNMFFLGIYNF